MSEEDMTLSRPTATPKAVPVGSAGWGSGPFWLTVLLSLLPAATCWALSSDSKQPFLIESDDMIYDETKGETVYNGNVKATQGSLEVTGDKMIVSQPKGEPSQMIMVGKPARLKQTPDGSGPDNHGLGDRLDYFPDSGILVLNGNAMTWQGPTPENSEHTVKSDHIEYDTKNSIYKAGTPKSAHHRVHVRVLPKDAKEE